MTKTLIPIFQRAEDLQLAIVKADVLPMTTTVQEARLNFEDWQVNFIIIGESHRIRIQQAQKFFLEEILACVDIESESCWHYHDFADFAEHSYQDERYQVKTYFSEKMPNKMPSTNCIEYHFPEIYQIQPITRIEWQLLDNSLRWWTLHTYAEAEKYICVHTESVFHF